MTSSLFRLRLPPPACSSSPTSSAKSIPFVKRFLLEILDPTGDFVDEERFLRRPDIFKCIKRLYWALQGNHKLHQPISKKYK
mmetsp:Transcript_1977/g.2869  ORF Transcript_1977/g.2869 Transcript_1977/m.2869 type:complete len:82 (+) Transcript_1977:3065-3310(+)